MTVAGRRRLTLRLVLELGGWWTIPLLANGMHQPEMTVRNDLRYLEKIGVAERSNETDTLRFRIRPTSAPGSAVRP